MMAMGAAGLVFGVRGLIEHTRCSGCHAVGFSVFLAVWGALSLLTILRGRAGLVFLLAAIVVPLVVIWARFYLGLVFLGVVFFLTRASKDRLAAYYRWERPA